MKLDRINVPPNSFTCKCCFYIVLATFAIACSRAASDVGQVANSTTTQQDIRRSGYHHHSTATAANADSHKENQFSSSSGFVPIAKPLIQDIYDISSSERNVNHLAHQQQQEHNGSVSVNQEPNAEQYHRYFSTQSSSYEQPKNDDSYGYTHNIEHYYDEGQQSRPESSRNYYKMPTNQQVADKFLNEKYPMNGHEEVSAESDSYSGKNVQSYQSPPPQKHRPYAVYNDEQTMFHPDSTVNMMKSIPQPPDYSTNNMNDVQANSPDQDLHSMLSQFANSNAPQSFSNPMKPTENELANLPQEFSGSSMSDFSSFNDNLQSSPLNGINGIAGFQPAPEGGQLPAPPGYKHVGYITIPAGATNLPNMMSQPSNGLPIIRPIPLSSVDMKMNHDKQELKKNQDTKMSESKPVRSFLSRLNPLNMLRKLRQRRERRQTSDVSSNDYMPISSKYNSPYGYNSMPSSYSMSPYSSGYSSISGLGGMSGVGGMYTSMSNISPLYMPGYGSYSGYGYSNYPNYGYMGQGSPVSSYPGDMKASPMSTSATELTASASAMSPAVNPVSPVMSPSVQSSHMAMPPMMMPMSMGGYGGMNGYPGMSSMPMSSMSMPYGYSGHPHMHGPPSPPQSSSPSNENNSNNQIGGINLNDLLKDEDEEEQSRFKKFLGYLNPMNIIKRFRNNTSSDERKRYGRYKRDLKLHSLNIDSKQAKNLMKRSDEESKNLQAVNDTQKLNTSELTDPMDDFEEILAHDTMPQVVHGRRKSSRRLKFNLMGSRNFEVIRGGTFQGEDYMPLRSSDSNDFERNSSPNSGNVLSEVEDMFNNDSPEIMGFQGFNGFSTMYNSLSASKDAPKIVELSKRSSKAKPYKNIEHAAINHTNSDLKAIS